MSEASGRTLGDLLKLSHALGREDRHLAILGEGNTSMRIDENYFAVKASGASLGTMTEKDFTVCSTKPILEMLSQREMSDQQVHETLLACRRDPASRKPSVETMFHGWLLTLPNINYVGHCHPVTCNQILCSPSGREFADQRVFPDQVVCCGPASVFVPYADPGLPLAVVIKDQTEKFMIREGYVPRLIVLANHGIIAIGATADAVLATILMAEKAAVIFVGASELGGPIFMNSTDVQRIGRRADEAYRQRQLNM